MELLANFTGRNQKLEAALRKRIVSFFEIKRNGETRKFLSRSVRRTYTPPNSMQAVARVGDCYRLIIIMWSNLPLLLRQKTPLCGKSCQWFVVVLVRTTSR